MKTHINGMSLGGLDDLCLRKENEKFSWVMSILWIFEGNVEMDQVYQAFRLLLAMYPRFRCSVYGGTNWSRYKWREHPNFNVRENIETHTLVTGTINELQEVAIGFIPKSMDYNKPLWKACIIYGINKGKSSAMVFSWHHCITDGRGVIRVMLDWTNNNNENIETVRAFRENIPTLPSISASIRTTLMNLGLQIELNHKEYKLSLQRKNLICEKDLVIEPVLSWSNEFKIFDVSLIKKAFNSTINDLMVTIVYRAIRRYFFEIDRILDDELMLYIPISIRSSSDIECHNKSIMLPLFLPLKDSLTIQEALKQVHNKIMELKNDNISSMLTFLVEHCPNRGMFESKTPDTQEGNRFSLAGHGVITNIIGPQKPITLAGQKVNSLIGLIPQPDPGSFGITIFSYNGTINVSIVNNKMPDYPNSSTRICELINVEFETLLSISKEMLNINLVANSKL
ncbi:wax ester/triacylglycerol synthase family O-acyltransferase [Gigaspora margarita]|uniref:Wax ester/triacylglycerol synthase family O-acyltransferase n=1 Tax=Gigaspora margarita TaxID=4874 RepID=A0A8H3XK82_GIGMA|nr:wax ester/triacylglycerol synthase family O-acyltransferase [Gigaspora margarita]